MAQATLRVAESLLVLSAAWVMVAIVAPNKDQPWFRTSPPQVSAVRCAAGDRMSFDQVTAAARRVRAAEAAWRAAAFEPGYGAAKVGIAPGEATRTAVAAAQERDAARRAFDTLCRG